MPSGKVVAVDEDVAAAGKLSRDTLGQEAAQVTADTNEERTSGVAEGAKAFAEGALDTATLGIYGAARGALDPDYARAEQARAENRGGARLAGEAATLLAPTGLLGDAAKGASELTGLGAASKVGELAAAGGGKLAGRAAEGAIYGVGGYVASTNVSGDPLTIEGAVQSVGVGGILNMGAGLIADQLAGKAAKYEGQEWDNRLSRAELDVGKAGAKAFSDTPPSWDAFRESHEAAVQAGEQFNREVAKEADAYESFHSSNAKLTKAVDKAQDVVNEIRNERYAPDNANVQYVEGKPRGVQYVYDEGATNERRILSNSKPPISDELRARLKDYNERISRVYKLKGGGWQLDETGKWVRDASVAANPQAAMEELRSIQADLQQDFPKASGRLTDLPPPPRTPVKVSDVELPKTLREFSKMHADTVARLANDLDPASQEAFGRLTQDLGLEVKGTPGETVAGVHERLGIYRDTIDKLKARADELAAEEAGKPLILKLLNKAAKYAVGRTVDVGGWMGAITRTLGGEAAGRVMNGVEDSVLGAALADSKQSVISRIKDVVQKYGVPTADAIKKLGPVTAYLDRSFPTGEKDPEKHQMRRAANRVDDIVRANMNGPDASFMALQGLLGHPSDVAWKMHQQVVNTLNHLMMTMPRDSGLDTHMFGSNWTPQWHEAVALAHRLEAAQDPVTAIIRAMGGNAHPAAAETLWALYPSIMTELQQEIAFAAPNMKKLTYQQASVYSTLFRTPMTGLQQPVVVTAIQGMYLPKPPPPGPAGGGGTGNPVGRPAAVQSPVAGSSVANLIQ